MKQTSGKRTLLRKEAELLKRSEELELVEP